MKKSIVCILSILILTLSLFPTACFSLEEQTLGGWDLELKEIPAEEVLKHKVSVTGYDLSPNGEIIVALNSPGISNKYFILMYDEELKINKVFSFREYAPCSVKWKDDEFLWKDDGFLILCRKGYAYEVTMDGQVVSLIDTQYESFDTFMNIYYGSNNNIYEKNWEQWMQMQSEITVGSRTVRAEHNWGKLDHLMNNRLKLTVYDGDVETVIYDVTGANRARVIAGFIGIPALLGLSFLSIFFSIKRNRVKK